MRGPLLPLVLIAALALAGCAVRFLVMDYRCVSMGGIWPECYGDAPGRYHRPMDGGGWSG